MTVLSWTLSEVSLGDVMLIRRNEGVLTALEAERDAVLRIDTAGLQNMFLLQNGE